MGLQKETSQAENGGFDKTRSRPVRSQREEFLLSLQKKTPENRDALQVSNIENDNLNISIKIHLQLTG